MNTGAIIMMSIGCLSIWGGLIYCLHKVPKNK